jgi:signal transduction histidine kinase
MFFMAISLIMSWSTIRYVSHTIVNEEKEEKLMSFATLPDIGLGDKSYDDILAEHDALDETNEAKIEILNKALAPMTDDIAKAYPGLGIGFYSFELDAIITYGPSSEFRDFIGKSIGEDHPGRIVMDTGKELVITGTMLRGDIMNAMHPLVRDDEVIGYIWANELTTEIEKKFYSTTTSMIILLCLFFVIALTIAIIFSRRTMRDLSKIVSGVRELHSDLSKKLEPAAGELGEVVNSINTMAADVAKANEERNALVMAEAANLAQRDFLARMSHEIRTPMNGVLGMTLLAMDAKSEPQRLNYLGKIHSSATLLLGIINDILDFSKIEAGKMDIENQPFSLRENLNNVQDLIMPRMEDNNLTLTVDIEDSTPDKVIGDGLRLSQVLLNLLSNAAKFTKDGSVRVDVKWDVLSAGMVRLFVSVEDTGIGMSEEQQANLFKPFSQADSSTARKFGGTGLGLSISKALVELMDGSIAVKSEPDKGSVFSFYISLELCKDEDWVEAEETHMLTQNFAGHTILVVEDNDINREIAGAIFGEMGLITDFAEDGEKGVEAFMAKNYDLIFMDIRMPVMDGIEATQKIRGIERQRTLLDIDTEHIHHVPIIAMTANAMKEDKEASLAAGMDGHISKPISLTEIQAVLSKTFNS